MPDHTPFDGEHVRTKRMAEGPPLGLDPVSPTRFGEIIDADRDSRFYASRPEPISPSKRDQLSRTTWVMIVIAGVVLGIAMAMIAAG
jgi:hypothetical protein